MISLHTRRLYDAALRSGSGNSNRTHLHALARRGTDWYSGNVSVCGRVTLLRLEVRDGTDDSTTLHGIYDGRVQRTGGVRGRFGGMGLMKKGTGAPWSAR